MSILYYQKLNAGIWLKQDTFSNLVIISKYSYYALEVFSNNDPSMSFISIMSPFPKKKGNMLLILYSTHLLTIAVNSASVTPSLSGILTV